MLIVTVDAVAAELELEVMPKDDTFDNLWNALSEIRGSPASIVGNLQYPRNTYSCVIDLPLPTPKDLSTFDSIPGLVFTKIDTSVGSAPLYQVLIKQSSNDITASVEFSSPVEAQSDTLEKLVSRADQIARFALIEKVTGPNP